jgi:hypothetical protein
MYAKIHRWLSNIMNIMAYSSGKGVGREGDENEKDRNGVNRVDLMDT